MLLAPELVLSKFCREYSVITFLLCVRDLPHEVISLILTRILLLFPTNITERLFSITFDMKVSCLETFPTLPAFMYLEDSIIRNPQIIICHRVFLILILAQFWKFIFGRQEADETLRNILFVKIKNGPYFDNKYVLLETHWKSENPE